MKLRTLEPHEIDLHRELRLRALQDAPDSFSETLAVEEARPVSYWEALTRSVTERGGHVMFLATEGEVAHGSTYGLVDAERNEAGRVGGMWVDPSSRRMGVGRALLHAVFAWARDRDFNHVRLWVPVHSPEAIAFYRQAGFRETEKRQSQSSNRPTLELMEMAREL